MPGPRRAPWAERTLGAIAVTAGNHAIVRVQVAYLVLFGATAMLMVAQAVVAFAADGAQGVAVLTLAQMVPTLFVVPIAAAMGQRVPRRTLLLGALTACVVGAGGTAALLAVDGPFVVLLGFAAVLAAGAGVGWSAMTAMLPDLARGAEELVGANVAATAAEGVGGLAGPLLASLLLVMGGPMLVSGVAAVALVGAVLVTAGIRPPQALHGGQVPGVARRGRRAMLGELTEGARVLWQLPGPRLIAIGAVAQTFVRGALGVLLVVLALDVLDIGESGVGLLTAAIGLGGLAGAALTALVMIDRPLGPVFGLALAAWGLPMVLLAPAPTTALALLAMVAVGVANAFVDVSAFGLLQGCIPDARRTAGLGAVRSVVSLGTAVGGIAASVLITWLGPLPALALVGATLPALAIIGWPRWRRLDEALLVPREQVAALRACPLFSPFTLAQLEQLAAGTQLVRFPAGHTVITEGDPGDAFYLLAEGEVAVSVAGRPARSLGPGEGFGEVALLRGGVRTATVTATTALLAYRVDAATFISAVSGSAVSRDAAEDAMRGYVNVPTG